MCGFMLLVIATVKAMNLEVTLLQQTITYIAGTFHIGAYSIESVPNYLATRYRCHSLSVNLGC